MFLRERARRGNSPGPRKLLEALERKLTVVARELEKTRARLQQAELQVQAAGERKQIAASTFRAVAERSRQELASCQTCRTRLRGSDLFVKHPSSERYSEVPLAALDLVFADSSTRSIGQ